MIGKGTPHDNGAKLADYLTKGKDGETAELWQLRGFAAHDIKEAFRSIHVLAEATKAEQPFFHVQVRLPEGEELTRQQWEKTANRIERMLGLKDQPRAIAFHIDKKTGEEHMHIAWSRIDAETMKAIPLPFFKDRLKKVCRELELNLGLQQVSSQRDGKIDYAPTRDEDEQARRLGVDVHKIRETIRGCYDRSDCGQSFKAALEHEGLILAQGDRRDYLVIDHAGGLYALGKKVLGAIAAQVRKKLADIEREKLPTLEQAREQVLIRDLAQVQTQIEAEQHNQLSQAAQLQVDDLCQRYTNDLDAYHAEMPELYNSAPDIAHHIETHMRAALDAEIEKEFPATEWAELWMEQPKAPPQAEQQPAPIWDRDAANREWEEAVINAAIKNGYSAGGKEKTKDAQQQPAPRPEPELNKTAGNIRLAYNLTSGPEAFRAFLQQEGLTAARVTALDIHERDSGKVQREKDDILRMLRNPAQIWMLQKGGIEALSPELRQRAEEAYQRWGEAKPDLARTYNLHNYVGYVQKQWGDLAEQHNIDVTKEQPPPSPEAEKKPRRLSDYARESDVVILDKWGNAYELTSRTTGNTRQDAQAFLAGIGYLPAIEDARREIEEKRRFGYAPPLEADIDLGKTAASIRLAYNLTDGPQAFRECLQQDGLTLANVTAQDIQERDSARRQENRFAAISTWGTAKPGFLDAEQSLPAPAPAAGKSGRLSDHAREGDVVILDRWGNAYELNQRTTGDTRRDAQAFVAGIGPLPSVGQTRRELEDQREQRQRPIRLPTGAQQGGLVAQQMWAVRRLQNAAQQRHDQQRRDEERRDRQQAEKQKADAGEVDVERYRADPEYRRQVHQAQSYKTPEEKQRDRENAAQAFLEQQDRQR